MTMKLNVLFAATLTVASVSAAFAGGADVKFQEMDTKVVTEGAVVNSSVLGSKSNLNVGGIQALSGKVHGGKFRAQIQTKGAIVNSSVLGSESNLNLGGIQTK